MTENNRKQLNEIMSHIEEMWRAQDTLFDELNATNGWGQKHGKDWVFGDLPYHLDYCNRDIIIYGLEQGENYPEEKQPALNFQTLGPWNDDKFAERPPGKTLQQEIAELHKSRDGIRQIVSKMNDDDLYKPGFLLVIQGWGTLEGILNFCRVHDWSEVTQLRIHMGKSEPLPSVGITNVYLGTMLQFFPLFLNAEAAAGKTFNTVMAFSDDGVGSWTLEAADGTARLVPGTAEHADLTITQSAETFEKVFRNISTFQDCMAAGLIEVSSMEGLMTFGQLFPM